MSQSLAHAAATEFLSVADQRWLIAAAQDVPCAVAVDDDGVERVQYGKTPASERALDRLTTSFLPALRKAARASKVLDEDDALSIVLTEFVAAVRRYDLTSDVPFSATIGTVLRYAVSDADRTSDLVVVRENVAARYWRLMHAHDFDVQAAYAECRDTSNGFDPMTFLAVHRAMSSVESIEPLTVDDEGGSYSVVVDPAPSPETVAVTADLVEWLFARVDDRQETILRLRYGFCDVATETFLVAHGLHLGSVLSDVQVSEVTGISRPTVSRVGNAALAVMRTALRQLVEDEA